MWLHDYCTGVALVFCKDTNQATTIEGPDGSRRGGGAAPFLQGKSLELKEILACCGSFSVDVSFLFISCKLLAFVLSRASAYRCVFSAFNWPSLRHMKRQRLGKRAVDKTNLTSPRPHRYSSIFFCSCVFARVTKWCFLPRQLLMRPHFPQQEILQQHTAHIKGIFRMKFKSILTAHVPMTATIPIFEAQM